ncbi:MAG: ATP-binding protein [Armatimonadota bacterium]
MLPTAKTPPKQALADLSVLVYGRPKAGKSSFCAQADDALFLATEAGLNHLDTFQAPINSWEELLEACADIAAGDHPFRTIILDTVDNAYRLCAEYVCKKHRIDHESDLGYGKGYALISNEFTRVLTKLSLLPYGLYIVSHAQDIEIETRTGKYTRTVPTLPEKARKVVLGLVDMILFVDFEPYADEHGDTQYRRVIRTKPSTTYEAGDRTGRLPEILPLDYQAFIEAFTNDPFRDQ